MHSSPQTDSRSSPVSGEAEVDAFIEKWSNKDGGKLDNYQLFIGKLCELFGVPNSDPASSDPAENSYVFERQVKFGGGSTETGIRRARERGQDPTGESPEISPKSSRFIDCYKRGHSVFDTKQGVEKTKARIRNLADSLDDHRKSRQAAHPDLTMTGMDNALEKLRSDNPLTAKETTSHEYGLVSGRYELPAQKKGPPQPSKSSTCSGKTWLQFPNVSSHEFETK